MSPLSANFRRLRSDKRLRELEQIISRLRELKQARKESKS